MNIKKLIIAAALSAVAGTVFANDLMPFTELDNFRSTKTRADVKAAVLRDQRGETVLVHGDLTPNEQTAVVVKNFRAHPATIESAKNHAVAPNGKTGS